MGERGGRRRFVRCWWAGQNDSRRMPRAWAEVLGELDSTAELDLNLACREERLHPKLVQVDRVPATYLPVKGVASLLCFPLRALDGPRHAGPQRDRIPGGYLALGRKPD